ncbi:exonuclease SbcCD subunit D (plasmid) [Roseobacter denitrificans]|uniref:Nuclease SbcCD subunit D n=1 Tax=Roseobacter denitrificans (strain ATCC 33942 / OCh 114) TaxID=375451 RepID=Q07GQ3_ROSDO|nr:exonuclease SbcCD subunit D [Roseobacter denitrificans]ABI93346.1 exonuclease SbcD, putative [Roseobacter denitrificans OCh 114]AVL51190.1 exonuclease SbcCD subunit D [Roseobacter denitrificans]SFG41087.1 Exodeoxyribonuclease I subunit D [Roseobacter denitrificans OCh 114]
MRVLHTADWHLGKTLRGVSLHEDQAHVLDQVFKAVVEEGVEVLLIAGDVYDKASPSEAAMKLYSDFLERVHEQTDAAIVVIAGNHDSGQRLGTASKLFDRRRILVRGPIERDETPLILEDEHGKIAISALPYGEIYSARRAFEAEDIRSPEDVLRAQIEAARARVPDDARWVVVAHAFVTNCQPTETERRLSVGTVETVSAAIFEGANYVALGHLHRPQTAGGNAIRYSGSPLAFGFDEAGTTKSMTVFDLDGQGQVVNLKTVDFEPLRQVREVRGLLEDLVSEAKANPSDDYIRAILLDDGALIEPAAQLRPHYPNILQTLREKKQDLVMSSAGRAQSKLDDPVGVIGEFLTYVRGEGATEREEGVVKGVLDRPVLEDAK